MVLSFAYPPRPVDLLAELKALLRVVRADRGTYQLAVFEAGRDIAFIGECEDWYQAMYGAGVDEVIKSCEVWLDSLTPARYAVACDIIALYGHDIANPFDDEYYRLRGLISEEKARRRLEETEEDADDYFWDDHALHLAEAFSPTVVA